MYADLWSEQQLLYVGDFDVYFQGHLADHCTSLTLSMSMDKHDQDNFFLLILCKLFCTLIPNMLIIIIFVVVVVVIIIIIIIKVNMNICLVCVIPPLRNGEDKDFSILHSQYHVCGWPGDAGSQGISTHDIDHSS